MRRNHFRRVGVIRGDGSGNGDLAAQFADHKLHLLKTFEVLFAAQSLEVSFQLIQRVQHRSWEVGIKQDLVDNVACLESRLIALQIK